MASPTPAPTSPHVIVEEEDGPFLTIVAVMLLLLAIGLVVAGTLYHSYKAAPVDEEEDPVEYVTDFYAAEMKRQSKSLKTSSI